MNERIEELSNKAIEDMPGAWNIPDKFCEKFAELIIKECTKIITEVGYKSSNDIPFETTDLFKNVIEFRFGVK